MLELPDTHLSNTYLFRVHDKININEQLHFGNVGLAGTTVTVTFGGVVQNPGLLYPDGQMKLNYPDLDSGPVKIQSSG